MRQRAVNIPVILLVLAFILVCYLVMLGMSYARQPYTRAAFESRFLATSDADVRAALGAPSRAVLGQWEYNGVTINPNTGKADAAVILVIDDHRVTQIIYPRK